MEEKGIKWVRTDKSSGTGNGTVKVTAMMNPNTIERSDTLTVKTESGLEKAVSIRQEEGPGTTMIEVSSEAGTARTDTSWLNGRGEVAVIIPPGQIGKGFIARVRLGSHQWGLISGDGDFASGHWVNDIPHGATLEADYVNFNPGDIASITVQSRAAGSDEKEMVIKIKRV